MGLFSQLFSFRTTALNVSAVHRKILDDPKAIAEFRRVFNATDGWKNVRAIAARNTFLCWYAVDCALTYPEERFHSTVQNGCTNIMFPGEWSRRKARLGDLLVQHLDLAAIAVELVRSRSGLEQVRSLEELTNLNLPISQAFVLAANSRFCMFKESAELSGDPAGKGDRLMFVSLIATHLGLQIHGDDVELSPDGPGRINIVAYECAKVLQAVYDLHLTA